MSEYKNESMIEVGLVLNQLMRDLDAELLRRIKEKTESKRRINNEELLELYADMYIVCMNALNEYAGSLLGFAPVEESPQQEYEEVSNFNDEGIIEPVEELEDIVTNEIVVESKNPKLKGIIDGFVERYKNLKSNDLDEKLEIISEEIMAEAVEDTKELAEDEF